MPLLSSANQISSNQEFKLWRSTFMLFLFQVLGLICMGIIGAVTSSFSKLNSASSISGVHKLCFVGLIFGSGYYGKWMEKWHSGVLDGRRIKKISILCTMIYFLIGGFFLLFILYPTIASGVKPTDLTGIVLLLSISIFFVLLVYFSMMFSIKFGIKSFRRK
jgi:hypothetical protein